MVIFSDKIALFITVVQTMSSDVIHFYFSKAFDSVNQKLKYPYNRW